MWSTWIENRLRSFDELNRFSRGIVDWYDLVVLTVQNQRGHVDLLQVVGKVGFGKRLDAIVRSLVPA